ncbi:DUF3189 family protein [Guptibacillus hwajinpoensis]|uniref:DUF3189 family protein n=1 Tax=Guptibacillus hwajinpoensis TaxID=208199 RepID=A0ABU0K1L8_9BACL|nr:DUF3189 family protein [Alkalihalobacillus hemicentroti]MDQ0483244.1 hypothetical protein [Alkalihalobacillus hemicentroti]
MIYIYNCYGGTHSSALAAAYHLNKLSSNSIPSKEEILNIDIFNKLKRSDMGRLIYHGEDEHGDKVYTLGRGGSKVLLPALNHLSVLFHDSFDMKEPVIFSNTSPTVPLSMTFGGMFARGLKMNWIGVPLLIIGAKQTHQNIVNLVRYTKSQRDVNTSTSVILENEQFK